MSESRLDLDTQTPKPEVEFAGLEDPQVKRAAVIVVVYDILTQKPFDEVPILAAIERRLSVCNSEARTLYDRLKTEIYGFVHSAMGGQKIPITFAILNSVSQKYGIPYLVVERLNFIGRMEVLSDPGYKGIGEGNYEP